MKGTMKITLKRIVSVLMALAMVVTSLNYSPKEVKAATDASITHNGKTYVIHIVGTDGITGAFLAGANGNPGFTFAWEAIGGGDNILTPTIKKKWNYNCNT